MKRPVWVGVAILMAGALTATPTLGPIARRGGA